ncbi:hypothetical protein C0992_003274 [Termitomyces sp. T32_za158]|nr:hypothetical protein C0992_003274 [Termitomyces sp. T32_za158]
MNNDDSRKRKATQAPNTSSKKHKSNIATTSRVTLDSPTRPTTRAKIRPVPCRRDLSPGASQSTADTYRTRSKTGSLKSTKKHPGSPSEDHTPPSTGGLSQWVAERQREKLRDIASQSSPKTSPTKKRSKAPPKPPSSAYPYHLDSNRSHTSKSESEDIIVISSDDDEKPRPRKRLRRRHTTQISEIIDLTKDETPPPPRSRPTRLRPAPLPTPTTAANLSTSASSSSPLRYLDLRYLSHKSKPKTTPPSSLSHSQTKTSPWPRKTRLPAAPSPAAMRRRRLNDMFDDDDEKSSHASKLPAVEVVINKYKVSSTAAPKVKSKPNVNPKTETKPGLGLEPEYNPNSTHAEGPKGELFQKDKMLTSKGE